jgi:addiction module HigA family antidote
MTRQPTHPGAVLREDVLPALCITRKAFAESINISRTMLYAILNEEKPITPETAIKLGIVLDNSPEMWLNMQMKYDVWAKRKALKSELKGLRPVTALCA